MNARQFLLVLKARKALILATLTVVVALTLAFSLVQQKTYQATASVLLNYKGVDPLTGLTLPGQLLPGYMATQIDIISSKNVALRVVDALHLAGSPAVIERFNAATSGRGNVRDWLAGLLLMKLEILPSRESSVVEISFKGSDPQFAAAVANAFADEYQRITVQMKIEPMKKASAYFSEQTRLLRENVETAQARLSKYQHEKGIVSLDFNRVDIELGRLDDLSQQLVAAQTLAMEGNSRREAELRTALAAQKAKVLGLNRARDELGVLLRDMDSAQRAFDSASQRLSQTRIEASSEQSDISILNPAVAPIAPAGPRVLLNTLVAALAGTVLGVGLGLLVEMGNRPVRSGGDIQQRLGVAVLGTMAWRALPARRRGLRALVAPRRLRLN
jgi:uncharacterized protein involved in exopolysaccharide biosynthesis